MAGRGGSGLSGEVYRVLLVLLSHLYLTTTTAVAEDDGEEFNHTKLDVCSVILQLKKLTANFFNAIYKKCV